MKAAILRQTGQDMTIEDIILGNPAHSEVQVEVAATFPTYADMDDVFPPGCNNCDGWLITGSRHTPAPMREGQPRLRKLSAVCTYC